MQKNETENEEVELTIAAYKKHNIYYSEQKASRSPNGTV